MQYDLMDPIATVRGDGAYDMVECYGAIGSPKIFPRRNTRINTKGDIAIKTLSFLT